MKVKKAKKLNTANQSHHLATSFLQFLFISLMDGIFGCHFFLIKNKNTVIYFPKITKNAMSIITHFAFITSNA